MVIAATAETLPQRAVAAFPTVEELDLSSTMSVATARVALPLLESICDNFPKLKKLSLAVSFFFILTS